MSFDSDDRRVGTDEALTCYLFCTCAIYWGVYDNLGFRRVIHLYYLIVINQLPVDSTLC